VERYYPKKAGACMSEVMIYLQDERIVRAAAGGLGILLLLLLGLWLRARSAAGRARREAGDLKISIDAAKSASAKVEVKAGEFERRCAELEQKYGAVIDVDAEIKARRTALAREEADLLVGIAKLKDEIDTIRSDYTQKKTIYDTLRHEMAALEDRLDLADIGMYRPVFELESSEAYIAAIEKIQAQQKDMIDRKVALTCETDWHVGGSAAKGQTMINRNIRLTLRAYNNECQVLIDKVTWKNYESVKARMKKVREAFDKLNESLNIKISPAFENLKQGELKLVHEEAMKRQEEKDTLREEREREREEAKAQRELQAEIARTERRERQREEALAEARSELAAATIEQREYLEAQVRDLEEQLRIAHEQAERTKSMAEQTRAGHVYIISNRGSFGEEIFKVGMTRRLEPKDRIKELGDASVPFPFDLHALIYTKDAPALERELHQALEDARVNRVNLKKEFFRVSGARVAEIIRTRFPEIQYDPHPVGQEYLGSLSKEEIKEIVAEDAEVLLPATL
jgi:phage shock protein A